MASQQVTKVSCAGMCCSNLIDLPTIIDDVIRKDVQQLLNNQEVVVNKTYGTSLVAVVIQESAKTLYSINYTHKQGLDFSFDYEDVSTNSWI